MVGEVGGGVRGLLGVLRAMKRWGRVMVFSVYIIIPEPVRLVQW